MQRKPPGFKQAKLVPESDLTWHLLPRSNWEDKERVVVYETQVPLPPTPRTGRAAVRFQKLRDKRAARKLMRLKRHGKKNLHG